MGGCLLGRQTNRPPLTRAQFVAARRLLKWSRERLAAKMLTNCGAVRLFEVDGIERKGFCLAKARAAFEAARVEFVNENGGPAWVRLNDNVLPVDIDLNKVLICQNPLPSVPYPYHQLERVPSAQSAGTSLAKNDTSERIAMTRLQLTPEQLVTARQLLNWSRDRLAAKMGSSNYAISGFEAEGVARKHFSDQRARQVLEEAGVVFLADHDGAGVRLRKAAK